MGWWPAPDRHRREPTPAIDLKGDFKRPLPLVHQALTEASPSPQ